jgi:Tripartite tricarboxylate transporter TctB family
MQRLLGKDCLSGLLFFAFGWGALHGAREFETGTLARMGPGWFPAALGVTLMLFGVFLMARGIGWPEKSPGAVEWGWRAPACIVASMLAFGFLVPRLGLVPALVAMFFLAALGGREFRWREVLVLTAVMTALAVGVFVHLLKLPFQLFPGFYLV